MKRIILLSFVLLSGIFSKAQQLQENDLAVLKATQNKHRNFENKIQKEIYDDHFKELENRIVKGYAKAIFNTDTSYRKLLQHLFNEFITKNKSYQFDKPLFYIINDNTPNATSAGFDYFFINTGMFLYLDNEYQLAAVLSHELAHNYLEHSKAEILQQAEFAKDFQKKMRSLRKADMIKLINSQDEVIQRKYDLAQQSRKKEIAADSLGYIFYSQLNYPKEEYLNLLNKLKQLDQTSYFTIKDETYQQLFGVNGVEIKSKWLKLEKDELYEGLSFTEHFDQDSIRSHPNTQDRIDYVTSQFKINSTINESATPSDLFLELKQKAESDYYLVHLLYNNYDYALYTIMNQKQKGNNDPKLDELLVEIFDKLHESRLKHEFNKYVSIANANDEDTDYHRFLNFLWNLPTPELKLIANYYKEKAAI